MSKHTLLNVLRTYWNHLLTESCALCAMTMRPSRETPGVCPGCLEDLLTAPGPFVLDTNPAITAARLYEGDTLRAIEALKMNGCYHVATTLARVLLKPLYEEIVNEWRSDPPPIIVPVPASVSGRWLRGFDQGRLLARELSPNVVPLIGRRRGRTQKTLNRDLRLLNAREQYHTRKRHRENVTMPGRVIIVDDVVTTGASIQRCGDILREMGCTEWRALALAVRL